MVWSSKSRVDRSCSRRLENASAEWRHHYGAAVASMALSLKEGLDLDADHVMQQ